MPDLPRTPIRKEKQEEILAKESNDKTKQKMNLVNENKVQIINGRPPDQQIGQLQNGQQQIGQLQNGQQQIGQLQNGQQQTGQLQNGQQQIGQLQNGQQQIGQLQNGQQQISQLQNGQQQISQLQNGQPQTGQLQNGQQQIGQLQNGQQQIGQLQNGQQQIGQLQNGQQQIGQLQNGQQQIGQLQNGQQQIGQLQDGQQQIGQLQNGQEQISQLQNGQQQIGQLQNGQPQTDQQQNGQPQTGQLQNGQPQAGQQQNGQQQIGQLQNGQPQAGQQQNGQQIIPFGQFQNSWIPQLYNSAFVVTQPTAYQFQQGQLPYYGIPAQIEGWLPISYQPGMEVQAAVKHILAAFTGMWPDISPSGGPRMPPWMNGIPSISEPPIYNHNHQNQSMFHHPHISELSDQNPQDSLAMSEFPTEGAENGDMQAVMENFQKKNLVTGRSHSHHPQVTSSSQMLTNQSQTSSSRSTVAKSSQRILTSSSSSEMKASSMKSDLTELKRGISEMKNISNNFSQRLRSSMENLVDRDGSGPEEDDLSEPLVTFPDPDTPPPVTGTVTLAGGSPSQLSSLNSLNNLHNMSPTISMSNIPNMTCIPAGPETMKFEQKKMTSASKTKVVTDGFSAEKATANTAEMRALQAGDVSYKEQSAATAARARVEMDGVSAEKSVASAREQRSLKAGDISHQESNNVAASTMKLQSDSFSSEKKAMAAQQQRQTVSSSGIYNHEKHMASSSQSSITIASKGVTSKSSMLTAASAVNQLMNGMRPAEDELLSLPLDDLDLLCSNSNTEDVNCAIAKYSGFLDSFVERLKSNDSMKSGKAPLLLNRVNEIIRKAWAVPTHGHELGYTLCNTLRTRGGLDLLISNCVASDHELQFSSARLLEQCLTTENRAHVVDNGLEKVVNVACVCTKNTNSVDHARVGTGILEHLFKHSEGTCSDVVRLGGLDAVLFECRKNDVETLRHCAGALANLSLYGGAENQEAMIKRKVPVWLFPLAFNNDDNIKYYACLAIAVLVANKEIEAAVLESGTLNLVEPFVTSHNPYEFAKSNLAHAHGQSKNWLERLVPVLSSKREEARNLAAFHFCMEAGIKKQQGNTEIFRAIGAIEPLKKVASCPNAVASKYAAQALRLIGEEIPHKLSQQVPLWSTEDVREWVKQIGFAEYAQNFVESRVDGDLLLQLADENLREDIGLTNGIQRRRFTRELQNLKKMADYSSRDTGNLNTFLQQIGSEFSIYTYGMLNAGVDKESIRNISDDQLLTECSITNSIHRLRILDAIKNIQANQFSSCGPDESPDKSLDVFVSYRRSNGSQLASLLKVHLQLRGFTVFIDVERLEAGKFDNNLLQSIRQAKHFLLVLTPKALERCTLDTEGKDWVHREIVAALQSQCNIIPIIDNFQWPEPEELPEDMRAVCHFNGVRWIHDYQDACVDKLERFMRGEMPVRADLLNGIPRGIAPKDVTAPSTPGSMNMRQPPNYQRMHSNESRGSDKDSTNGRD